MPHVHLDTMATIDGVPLDNPLHAGRFVVTSDYVGVWERDESRLWIPTAQLRGIDVSDATTIERRVPGWAIVLGIIGLFFFLIGVLFFFIKQDRPVPGALVTVLTADGRVVRAYVRMPFGVVHGLLWPLSAQLATRATQPGPAPGDPLPPPR
jgi:hypothetical protein